MASRCPNCSRWARERIVCDGCGGSFALPAQIESVAVAVAECEHLRGRLLAYETATDVLAGALRGARRLIRLLSVVVVALVGTLVFALLSGCVVDEQRARVHVVVAVDAPELAEYVDGANAWSRLGYLASFDATGLPDCADVRDAFDGSCEVVVYVARGRVVENYGAAGVTSRDSEGRRVSILDVRYSGLELVALAAHELGHSLLDTSSHVADPAAVMFHASVSWTPQPDDYALACSSIGVCP